MDYDRWSVARVPTLRVLLTVIAFIWVGETKHHLWKRFCIELTSISLRRFWGPLNHATCTGCVRFLSDQYTRLEQHVTTLSKAYDTSVFGYVWKYVNLNSMPGQKWKTYYCVLLRNRQLRWLEGKRDIHENVSELAARANNHFANFTITGSLPYSGQSDCTWITLYRIYRYKFYKPTTWFHAPKTVTYCDVEPNVSDPSKDEDGQNSGSNVTAAPQKPHSKHRDNGPPSGYLWVWIGSFKRWKRRFVQAESTGDYDSLICLPLFMRIYSHFRIFVVDQCCLCWMSPRILRALCRLKWVCYALRVDWVHSKYQHHNQWICVKIK